MKTLAPFLAGFALAMAMHTDKPEVASWVTMFFIAIVGTIAFTYLEDK